MSMGDYVRKTYAKNNDKWLLLIQNPHFIKKVIDTLNAWSLPVRGWERFKDADDPLDQVMRIFLLRHLPELVLKVIYPLFPKADCQKILDFFNLYRGIAQTGSSQVSSELKDRGWELFKDDPNRHESLILGEKVSFCVYSCADLFVKEILGFVSQLNWGKQWCPIVTAYVLTGDATLAAQFIPPINVDIKYWDGTTATIEQGPNTTQRDLDVLYSVLNRMNRMPRQCNYPLRNLKRDLQILDRKRMFKTNKQNYDGDPFTSCYDEPTCFESLAAKIVYEVVNNRDFKKSLLKKENLIRRRANCLKRGTCRTERRVKEIF